LREPKLASAARRALDCTLASAALLLVSPLLLLTGVLTWLTLGRPILFRQARTGLGGRLFTLYKFRTMTEARDADGRPLPDKARLTPVGRFLRWVSFDEFPQLLNVLKGDMSLVGPRPLLPEYLARYNAFQRRRHEVKPGITGWAQVNGRNTLTWEQKFELDVWYVDHWTLWLDLKILAMTLWQVVTRRGISQPGHATMPEFSGSPHSTGSHTAEAGRSNVAV